MREVVLALTLALVAGQHVNFAPSFATGKTYKYKYEAVLLGGLPEEGLARAGVKVKTKVLISAFAPNSYLLKLVQPELLEYSGIWPKDAFLPATKLTTALAAQLTIPIRFEYTHGVVGKVYAPEGISEMVMNIYRGILNTLQLNIKKTQNVYELQEPGAQGVCKTLYAITEDEKTERILLTKTRDLNHCQERIIKDIGLAYTEKCVECQQDTKNLRGTAAYNYILKPVADGVLILEAAVTELIQFSPFNEMNGAAQMETKQSLVFLETERTPLVPIDAEYLHRGSLKYEFTDEILQTPIQLIKIKNLQAQIVEVLNHLVANNVEKVHEDAPLKFMELIQLLRKANYAEIEMIWNQFRQRPAYRTWILDTLPAIGTADAMKFIKDKIIMGDLTVAEAVQALAMSVHTVTADREVIKLFEALALNSRIVESPVLREIALLGYGTMVSKYCSAKANCPADLVKPIHNLIVEAVAKNEIDEIVLLLKVLGNAGHPISLKPITKVLPIYGTPAASLPVRVHVDAILAMRNIAKKEPKMIQEMAIQLYMDRALHPELRMLACIVLFETKPSMGLVTTLANILKTEENLQLASFTYSHMKSLTRSTAAIHASVAAACNVAIKMLRPKLDRLSYRFSKAIHVDTYSNPLMLGAAATAFYINDAATVLPRSVVIKTRGYLAGAAADVLEIGIRTEGLQEALLKNPAIAENVDRITKMRRAIKALSQWRSLSTRKPLASIYVKFFGQELGFGNIDKPLIDQAIALATEANAKSALKTLLSGASFHCAKPLLAAEVRRIFPTAAGLPMELSLYTTAVTGAAVQIKATTTPALPQSFQLAHLLKTEMMLETELKPSIAVHTFAVMGVNTALLQAAMVAKAKLNALVPAKISISLDIKKGNFKIVIIPVAVPENLAEVRFDTLAVVRNIEDPAAAKMTPVIPAQLLNPLSQERLTSRTTSSLASSSSQSSELLEPEVEADLRPLIKTKVIPFEKKYCAKLANLGVKSCLKVDSENAGYIKDTALYKLVGKHIVTLSVKAGEGAAIERLELEIQIGPEAAGKLIKPINLIEEESAGGEPVLTKLRKILVPGLKNRTASSSSSSSSQSSSSRSSRRSASSSLSSSSSSRVNSRAIDAAVGPAGKVRGRSSSSSSSRSSRLNSSQSVSSSSSSSSRSLSSSSSSSSSSSTRLKTTVVYNRKFQKNHIKQTVRSRATSATQVSRSRSSASSLEAIYKQKKYLGHAVPPLFAIIARAVRADQKVLGYELSVYLDKPDSRLQIILAALAEDDKWKFCADGALLSKHKVSAKVGWGAECKQYITIVTAETGLAGKSPAARLRVAWNNLPSALKRYAKKIDEYLATTILADLIEGKEQNSEKQISLIVIATSDKTLDLIVKSPKRTFYKLALRLPIALPLGEVSGLTPFTDNMADKIQYLVSKANAAECSFNRDILTTFNDRRIRNERPLSCYQVLAQDCTDELKFMVLLKKDNIEENHINVKIENIDIDLYPKNDDVIVKVNGIEIPINNLPYQHPTAKIQIIPKGEGISVYAPSHGLHEVYFDKDSFKVKVVDWMKGQTCGLCGKADGEVKQEYRIPNGRLSKSSISYAHSWVLPAESCRDTSECRMKLESVKLEKEVIVHGQESKCYSVEPVLRCLAGCFPVKTAQVTVGFHCLPADSALNRSEGLPGVYDKSVDLRETTEAHLACNCTAQCS